MLDHSAAAWAHQAITARYADTDDVINDRRLNLTRAAHACKVAIELTSPVAPSVLTLSLPGATGRTRQNHAKPETLRAHTCQRVAGLLREHPM